MQKDARRIDSSARVTKLVRHEACRSYTGGIATRKQLQFHSISPTCSSSSSSGPPSSSSFASVSSSSPAAPATLSPLAPSVPPPTLSDTMQPSKVGTLGLPPPHCDGSSKMPLLFEPHSRIGFSSLIMSHKIRRYNKGGVHLMPSVTEADEQETASHKQVDNVTGTDGVTAMKNKAKFACGRASRAVSMLRSSFGFAR
eukprot:TRINITY_DN80575_c0_g1_i1.p1 TRINITY_DN80575_c0_g1~~TRINITY_DN80575_c0_g1_i1.p1  ORF type:complete len:198 (+),score=20.77 TRINITY_DN80575_c0_g1_i1:70-663(+)